MYKNKHRPSNTKLALGLIHKDLEFGLRLMATDIYFHTWNYISQSVLDKREKAAEKQTKIGINGHAVEREC